MIDRDQLTEALRGPTLDDAKWRVIVEAATKYRNLLLGFPTDEIRRAAIAGAEAPMIDRDQLTEAINGVLGWHIDDADLPDDVRTDHNTLLEAARLLLDFPTDEMVEAAIAAAEAMNGRYGQTTPAPAYAMAALEAVRQVMFGDES